MVIDIDTTVENGVSLRKATSDKDFFAVGHEDGSLEIILMTPIERPRVAGEKIRSRLIGFIVPIENDDIDSAWNEMMQEIEDRGLNLPEIEE